MTYKVFISYSRKDSRIADRICEELDKAGITYFIDREAIKGSEDFPDVISQAIGESELFLFLASRNSYQSVFTNKRLSMLSTTAQTPRFCLTSSMTVLFPRI